MKRTPSSRSAARLARGDVDAIGDAVLHLAGRAFIVGVGLAVAGEREHIVRNAIAAACAIEVALIAYQASDYPETILDGLL